MDYDRLPPKIKDIFDDKCQTNQEAKVDYDFMKENLKFKKQLAELQKENDFLK